MITRNEVRRARREAEELGEWSIALAQERDDRLTFDELGTKYLMLVYCEYPPPHEDFTRSALRAVKLMRRDAVLNEEQAARMTDMITESAAL